MASRAVIFVAFFASVISVILSHPQIHILPIPQEQQQQEPVDRPEVPSGSNVLPGALPNLQSRTFGSLFNLSAYLANAPTNGSALNFVPLITVLSALG